MKPGLPSGTSPRPGVSFRPRLRAATALALAGTVALSACSSVKVKTRPERVAREGLASARLLRGVVGAPVSILTRFADASHALLEMAGRFESQGATLDAAGCYLEAAAEAHALLAAASEAPGSEAETALLDIHNSALARFAVLWIEDPRRMNPGPYRFTCEGETLEITLAADSAYAAGYFDRFVAAASLEEKGVVRSIRAGFGAALVGIREPKPERPDETRFYPENGLHVPVTLTMNRTRTQAGTEGRLTAVTLALRNPMVERSVAVGRRTFPVAANFSAPIAVALEGRSEVLASLAGFFRADQRISQSGIFLTEPYDPKRIPVLFIHGLVSVPMIWRNVVPQMMADPEISRRYQFMVFTYPSSYAVAESALLLRNSLADLRSHYDPNGNDPLSNNLLVAGHSMGGILTHTLVADIGDNFWKQVSDAPFDAVPGASEEREHVRELVFFGPDPAVRRAIFIATPHRGAEKATKRLSTLISRIAKLPSGVIQTTTGLLDMTPNVNARLRTKLGKKVTAVQSLEPGAPMVSALDASPYRKGVVYHSIIGDRGKGDTPNSSDGTVEYWSARQDGAASEVIVPTNHQGAYNHPKAVAEIRRILYLHAAIRP